VIKIQICSWDYNLQVVAGEQSLFFCAYPIPIT